MKVTHLLFFSFLFLSSYLFAQEDHCSDRYRSKVFPKVSFEGNVLFGYSEGLKGENIPLRYDVYMPADDTLALRPLIILWHGGAFLDIFKKTSPDIVLFAKDLAKMGYVVISPDYRGIRDITDFFRRKDLIKIVTKAAIDGNKAICHILDNIDHGNPYRIDKDAIFAGGVSGGAILGLHLILLNQAEDLTENYAQWAREVDAGIIDELLKNKYCGEPDIIKGFFNISGALVDTSFIRLSNTGFVHFHGSKDDIVPYDVGVPLGDFTDAPIMYGSKPIHEKLQSLGSSTKFYSYQDLGHAPFLNLDLEQIIQQLNIVNKRVYDETIEAMAEYMFARITCEPQQEVPTSIVTKKHLKLSLYPNPSSNFFEIDLPDSRNWNLDIYDIAGKKLLHEKFQGKHLKQNINFLSKGIYIIQVRDTNFPDIIYISKLIKEDSE